MTESADFKPGDVVRLKSGSPDMIIDGGDWSAGIPVRWFEHRSDGSLDLGSPREAVFSAAALELRIPERR